MQRFPISVLTSRLAARNSRRTAGAGRSPRCAVRLPGSAVMLVPGSSATHPTREPERLPRAMERCRAGRSRGGRRALMISERTVVPAASVACTATVAGHPHSLGWGALPAQPSQPAI